MQSLPSRPRITSSIDLPLSLSTARSRFGQLLLQPLQIQGRTHGERIDRLQFLVRLSPLVGPAACPAVKQRSPLPIGKLFGKVSSLSLTQSS